MKPTSKRAIVRRNQRINGERNAQSLAFMEYIRTSSDYELETRTNDLGLEEWKFAAICRELDRRNKKEGKTS